MPAPSSDLATPARWSAISRVTFAEARAGSSACGLAPESGEALADGAAGVAFGAQFGQPDAVRARIGEGRVGGAGTGEVGIELDDVADIDDNEKRRPAFRRRQRAGVTLGLAAGALHGVVEAPGGGAGLDLLGFEHEVAALVAVDAAGGFAAVAVAEGDAALEDVGVVARVFACRVGRLDAEQAAEVGDEELVVGELGAVGVLPAGEEVPGESCALMGGDYAMRLACSLGWQTGRVALSRMALIGIIRICLTRPSMLLRIIPNNQPAIPSG